MTTECPECHSTDVRTDDVRSSAGEVEKYYHCNTCEEEWPLDGTE